jgi:hypothetical protein
MAEIRTNVGTCGLKEYGTTIAQVYDNLLATAASESIYGDSNDFGMITGMIDDSSFSSAYQSLN